MADKRWIGGAQAVRWQETFTPAPVSTAFDDGDKLVLSINRKEITAESSGGAGVVAVAEIVDAWIEAIQDSNEPEWQEVEIIYPADDSDASTHLTLAGPEDGSPVILSASTVDIADFTIVRVREIVAGRAAVNEQQIITLDSAVTGGTFTLSFEEQETTALAYDAAAATVETALEVLSTIDDVTVTGDAGGPWTVEFDGTQAGMNVSPIVGDGASLTSSTTALTVREVQEGGTPASGYSPTIMDLIVPSPASTWVKLFYTDPDSNEHASAWFHAEDTNDMRSALAPFSNMNFFGDLTYEDVTASYSFSASDTKVFRITIDYAIEKVAGQGAVSLTATGNGVYLGVFDSGYDSGTPEIQEILVPRQTGGTFKVSYQGDTTASITMSTTLSASTLETALTSGIAALSGEISVVRADDGSGADALYLHFFVVFDGSTLAGSDVPMLVAVLDQTTGYPVGVGTSVPGVSARNEKQSVALQVGTDSGTFTLTFDGETTGNLTWDESAADINTALEGLTTTPDIDDVTVTGPDGGPWLVEFAGNLAATDIALMTGNGTNLTGSGSEKISISECQAPRGPNWLDDPDNYESGVAVADGDVLVCEAGAVSILYGLDCVLLVTVTGSPTGGTFTLTYRDEETTDLTHDESAADIQTALEALDTLAEDGVTVSGSAGGPWTLIFHGFPTAADGTVLLTADGTDLTGGSSPDVTVAATYLTLDVRAKANYTGQIGLPPSNGSYPEYRPQRLKTGITGDTITVNIGEGDGSGSGLIRLDTGASDVTMTVYGTGSRADDLLGAVDWIGTGSSNAITIYQGTLSAALYETDGGAIDTLTIGYEDDKDSDVEVYIGAKCTLATVDKRGGVLEIGGRSGSAITAITNTAGTVQVNGSDAVSQITMGGGRLYYNTTGTLGGNTVLYGAAVLDFSRNLAAKTVTNPIDVHGDLADVYDPEKVVTSLIVDYNYSTRQAGIGRNVRITRGTPA